MRNKSTKYIGFVLVALFVVNGCASRKAQKVKKTDDLGYYYIAPFNPDKDKNDENNKKQQETPKQIPVPQEPPNVTTVSRTTTEPESVKEPETNVPGKVEFGIASYYGDKFHGRKTASGELYDKNMLTAAHKKLPFGTMCKVTNLANNKSVVVKINDRGPFVKGRIIDLSSKAYMTIGDISKGVIDVKLEVIK